MNRTTYLIIIFCHITVQHLDSLHKRPLVYGTFRHCSTRGSHLLYICLCKSNQNCFAKRLILYVFKFSDTSIFTYKISII